MNWTQTKQESSSMPAMIFETVAVVTVPVESVVAEDDQFVANTRAVDKSWTNRDSKVTNRS